MKNKNIYLSTCLGAVLLIFTGCKKGFLDVKPSTTIVQPVTLDNMIGLLDNEIMTNCSPILPVLSADEYVFLDYPTWQATYTATERNSYIWAADIFAGQTGINDWSVPYTAIFYTNNVLSGLENINVTADNRNKWQMAKGWALFNRAYSFFNLAKTFCKVYDEQSAQTDLGIPIKLKPEIDEIEQRSSLKQTYLQILGDLNSAKSLLALTNSLPSDKRNRPSLTAVYALQARIYLSMRDYSKAELASDSCLALYPKLIDYNTVDTTAQFPFINTNDESIYATGSVVQYSTVVNLVNTQTVVEPSLVNLFATNDLRSKIYFLPVTGGYVMKSNYLGQTLYPYTGLATDEIYLIKAECAARRGSITASLEALNKLLIKRYASSTFSPLTASTATQALDIVLLERRKELIWRGLRWDDLKRLNKEGANITLNRVLNGIKYTLAPNDPRYVLPIPSDEIALSKITQNQR